MNYPFPYVLDADSLNVGLLYVILGTVGFAAGAALAPSPPPQRAADSRGALPLSLPGFLLAWLAALGVSVFFFAKGVNSFDAAGPPVPFAWLVYFFNPDVAALLTLAIPLLFPQFLRRHRWIIAAFLVAYLVFGTLHGSRGTPLRLAMMAVLMLVAFRDDARLSIRDLSFALALLVPASLFTFVLGTGIRYVHMGLEADVAARQVLSDQKVTYTSGTVIAPGCVSSLHAEAEPGREPGSGSSHVLSGLTARVVARLGIVDYAVEIVSRPGDRNVLDHYMTVRYAVKNFANNLVIGTPYPESEIMTSRVIPMAYRGCNEAWVRSAVQTSPWTAWGLSYVLFGWWGGLAALGVAGYLVQLGVVGLRRWSGPAAGAFVGAFFFLFVYAAVLQTGGLDASATVSCYLMLATCVTVALAYSPLLLQRFRRRDG
jgi:hypothetical protein